VVQMVAASKQRKADDVLALPSKPISLRSGRRGGRRVASAPMARKVTYGQAKAKASDAASRPKETRQADDR
jgi:hypothetical protein